MTFSELNIKSAIKTREHVRELKCDWKASDRNFEYSPQCSHGGAHHSWGVLNSCRVVRALSGWIQAPTCSSKTLLSLARSPSPGCYKQSAACAAPSSLNPSPHCHTAFTKLKGSRSAHLASKYLKPSCPRFPSDILFPFDWAAFVFSCQAASSSSSPSSSSEAERFWSLNLHVTNR